VDTGEGFAFKDVPEVGSARADTITGGERIGGFGMGLVRALADKLEFHRTDPHGTTVHASVALHYPSPNDQQKAQALDQSACAEVSVTRDP
jgi:anti-sigma regulatory factor (Ser/Thr protein kinase)